VFLLSALAIHIFTRQQTSGSLLDTPGGISLEQPDQAPPGADTGTPEAPEGK